jgi:uncharacterized protein DUF3237
MPNNEPRLEFLFRLTAMLGEPITIGDTLQGTRVVVPVIGGGCEGPHLKADMHGPGADWVVVRSDGVGVLDVRGQLQTADGASIFVHYSGYLSRVGELMPRWAAGENIPRDEYYFISTPYFETSAAQYAWLQNTVTVGIGELIRGGVAYDVYAVGAAVSANPLPQPAAAARR